MKKRGKETKKKHKKTSPFSCQHYKCTDARSVGLVELIRLEQLGGKVSHSSPSYEWVSPKDCARPYLDRAPRG